MFQEFLLSVGAFASENVIAMGKASETGDDIPVAHSVVGRCVVAECLEQGNATLLVFKFLAMFERQVEEGFFPVG